MSDSGSTEPGTGEQGRRQVGLWLAALTAMVLVMVSLGGATRLTGSGLSMVEWRPFHLLPPLSEAAWQAEFALYRDTAQFRLVNGWMALADFKEIYWLEYVHRVFGRLIGFSFLVPFAAFLAKGWIGRADSLRFLVLFALGGLQGLLGWLMVKSGLAGMPQVSHYRLAAHLFAALLIYAGLLWSALDYLRPRPAERPLPSPAAPLRLLLAMLFLAIPVGGLVAGLHAGHVFNTFPLMNGEILPAEAFDLAPVWRNVTENPALLQFLHRLLGLAIWLLAMAIWVSWRRATAATGLRQALAVLAAAATLQIALGIATLLLAVPLPLALAHQAGAFLLFGAVLWACHETRR